jgi:hypothetical protein
VHVHDAGRDGFNGAKRPRRQANADENAGKDAHENNFTAARSGWRFWFHSFHAAMLWQMHHRAESKKLRGTLNT